MHIATQRILSPVSGKAALYIEAIHEYRFLSDRPAELLPQGRFEMIFQIEGEFLHRSEPGSEWFSRPQAFLGGLHAQAYAVQSLSAQGRCLGVSLRPEMAHQLIREGLNVYENAVVDLEAVFGSAGRRLAEAVNEGQDLISKTKQVEEFMRDYPAEDAISAYSHLISRSLSVADDSRIADVSREAGLSESYFRKLFREKVGMSAKRFFKIRRINKAIALIRDHPTKQLTTIAYELGFFDQSHFIREFKSITGKIPKEYHS